jgi:hypothetical protein
MMKLICDNGSFAFYYWKLWYNLTFLPWCKRTADVNWQCDLGILCYGDLLEGRLFNVELYETIIFIHLFNGADLKAQIIYRGMRNGNVIMISELVKDVGESTAANTNYRI